MQESTRPRLVQVLFHSRELLPDSPVRMRYGYALRMKVATKIIYDHWANQQVVSYCSVLEVP